MPPAKRIQPKRAAASKKDANNRKNDPVFSPSVIPTNRDKQAAADNYNKNIPYGLISKKPINWVKNNRTILGEGSYGQVYKYTDTPNGVVAVKFMKHEGEIKEPIIKEISFLTGFSHPNVISILDIFYDSTNIAVILPLADFTLDTVRKTRKVGNKDLTPKLVDSLLYQVLRGIVATEEHNILNGDYKALNILIYDKPEFATVKIADYGLAGLDSCYNITDNSIVFTIMYRSPELLWQYVPGGPTTRQEVESDIVEAEKRLKELKEAKRKRDVSTTTEKKKRRGRKPVAVVVPQLTAEQIQEEEKLILLIEEQIIRLKNRLERPFPNKIGKNTKKADSWAYGVIIYELITNSYPFNQTEFSIISTLEKIYTRLGRPTQETLPDVADMPIYTTLKYIEFDLEFDSKIRKSREEVPTGYRTLDTLLSDKKVIPEEYRKYIPIIESLLVIDPRKRPDPKDLLDSHVFDTVREEVDNNMKYKDVKQVRSPDKCSKYLRNYQYKKINKDVQIFETPRIRYILYDWLNEVCEEYRLPPRIKAIACKIVELFAVKNLEEAKRDNTTPSWIRQNYQAYLCAAILLACKFDGEGLEMDDLTYITDNSVTKETLFTYALTIFASVDFNMVKSTSYDIFEVYKTEDIEGIGLVLLQFTYFTELYSNFNSDIIASLIYIVSCIIRQRKINKKYARRGIGDAWDIFRDNLVSLFTSLMKNHEIGLTTYVVKKGERKTNGEDVVKAIANIATPLGLPYTPFDKK